MKKGASSLGGTTDADFIRRTLIFIGIVAFAAALYALSDILLLVFGAILVAVVLRTIARPIRSGTSMSERLALCASGLGVAIVIGGTAYLFGSQIASSCRRCRPVCRRR
jgi:predicted PurR-regulated permease PerM